MNPILPDILLTPAENCKKYQKLGRKAAKMPKNRQKIKKIHDVDKGTLVFGFQQLFCVSSGEKNCFKNDVLEFGEKNA